MAGQVVTDFPKYVVLDSRKPKWTNATVLRGEELAKGVELKQRIDGKSSCTAVRR